MLIRHALGKTQCFEWFKKFKSGDFNVRTEERGRPPRKFENAKLQALLDEDLAKPLILNATDNK